MIIKIYPKLSKMAKKYLSYTYTQNTTTMLWRKKNLIYNSTFKKNDGLYVLNTKI